ncbi:hypothetical protein GCM10027563_31190 [Parasphingorhabdus pacifica]
MFALAVAHSALTADHPARVQERLGRLAASGVRLPDSRSGEQQAVPVDSLARQADLLVELCSRTGRHAPHLP